MIIGTVPLHLCCHDLPIKVVAGAVVHIVLVVFHAQELLTIVAAIEFELIEGLWG